MEEEDSEEEEEQRSDSPFRERTQVRRWGFFFVLFFFWRTAISETPLWTLFWSHWSTLGSVLVQECGHSSWQSFIDEYVNKTENDRKKVLTDVRHGSLMWFFSSISLWFPRGETSFCPWTEGSQIPVCYRSPSPRTKGKNQHFPVFWPNLWNKPPIQDQSFHLEI